MDKKYRCILFDLGGVLAELDMARKMQEWLSWRVDKQALFDMWLHSESVRAHESGAISPLKFADSLVREFGLPMGAEEFLKEFPSFVKGLYPGTEELLQELSANYPIAILSNVSEMHWKKACEGNRLADLVKKNFLSYKTGYMKPDKEAFENVVTELACEPDEILYFDDSPSNVEAARACGIQAVLVAGHDELRQKLSEMGIICYKGRQVEKE